MSLMSQGTKFEISADGVDWIEIGCIQTWTWDQPERAEIDTTCLTSSSKEFAFGLRDSGTVALDYQYDPEGDGQGLLEESYASDKPYHFQVTYSNEPDTGGTGTVKAFEGYVTSLSENGAVDDVVSASCSIKITGDITVTDPVTNP